MKKGKYQIMQERRESAISSIKYLLGELRDELRERQMEYAEDSMERIEREIAAYRDNLPEYREPESIFEVMAEEYRVLVAPLKAVKQDAELARAAARLKGENSATDKQLAYLTSLGYRHDGSYLSKAEASAKIESYKANQERDYLAKEMLREGRFQPTFQPHAVAECPALARDKMVLLSAVEYLLSEGYITLVEPSDISPIYATYRLTGATI